MTVAEKPARPSEAILATITGKSIGYHSPFRDRFCRLTRARPWRPFRLLPKGESEGLFMIKRNGKWYTDFWHEGIRFRKSLGQVAESVAARKEATFKASVYDGSYFARKKNILFASFANKYLDHIRLHKKPNTHRRYSFSVASLKKHFAGTPLAKISMASTESFKKKRIEWHQAKHDGRDPAPATINRDIRTLSNMTKLAVDWGYLARNPLERVPIIAEDNEKMWVLTAEEEARLPGRVR